AEAGYRQAGGLLVVHRLRLPGVAQPEVQLELLAQRPLARSEYGVATSIAVGCRLDQVVVPRPEESGSQVEDRVLETAAVEEERTHHPVEVPVRRTGQPEFLGEVAVVLVQPGGQHRKRGEVPVRPERRGA